MGAPATRRGFTVPASPSVDLIEWGWWLLDVRGFGASDLLDVIEKPDKYADLYAEYREQA